MKTRRTSKKSVDFYFADVDTFALVEDRESGVIVRVTRNSLSSDRKTRFIRELAAEGFISSQYEKYLDDESASWLNVRWFLDHSWLRPDEAVLLRTRQNVYWAFGTAAAILIVLMGLAVGGYLP